MAILIITPVIHNKSNNAFMSENSIDRAENFQFCWYCLIEIDFVLLTEQHFVPLHEPFYFPNIVTRLAMTTKLHKPVHIN